MLAMCSQKVLERKKKKTDWLRAEKGTHGETVRQCGAPVLGNMGEGRQEF